MAITRIARVRIFGRGHAGQTVNVLHFGDTELISDGNTTILLERLVELATNIMECVVTTLLPALPSDWRLEKVSAQYIGPGGTDDVEVTPAAVAQGAQLNPTVSFGAQLVRVRTGGGGRKGRGRIFLPYPGEDAVTDSKLTAPQLVLLATFLACIAGKYLAPNGTEPFRIGVLSRVLAGVNSANAVAAFREAITLTPVDVMATMHSRKISVGS